jgi:broad specificity phosphatase PhoE
MILLRHGQSEFNLHMGALGRDPGIIDPKLTPLGHVQARRAAEALIGQKITRIIASPYTRTMQTAAPIARSRGMRLDLNPLVRERYALACDVGRPASALASVWPEHDFAHIGEAWWPAVEEPTDQVVARAVLFRAEMSALSDQATILVVSHWGFILAMTGTHAVNGQILHCDPHEPGPATINWQHR